ncbi:MAG: HEAT repeat domain-containing protein [Planctomycetota bacterium]
MGQATATTTVTGTAKGTTSESEAKKKDEFDKWQKEQGKKESTEEKQEPKPKPTESAPTDPASPLPSGDSQSGPAGDSASRPDLGIGLQPLIQSLRSAKASLLGVAEPWEVWWSRHRDRYLLFRESVVWMKTSTEKGSQSVNVYPAYNELINILSAGLFEKAMPAGCINCPAAIALGKAVLVPGGLSITNILKKAIETKPHDCTVLKSLLGLGFAGDAASAGVIKEVLQSKTEPALKRAYAALALGYLPAAPEISDVLKTATSENEDFEVRCSACLSLGNMKDVSAIPVLGKLLNKAQSGGKGTNQVRAYAALALGRIGGKDALSELKKCAPSNEENADVSAALAIALGLTGLPEAKEQLVALLQVKNPVVRGLAAVSLTQLNDKKAYDIIYEAWRNNKASDAEGLMVLALALTGNEKAKAELRRIFENRKSRLLLKAAAITGLGLLKDAESIPLIVNILKNKRQQSDEILTPYLILSLGMIRDAKGIEVLQEMWRNINPNNAQSFTCHSNLAIALTLLGKRDEIVMPELLKQAKQAEYPLLRAYALHTLGLVGNKESAPVFAEAYKDADPYVRFSAIEGAGFLLDKNARNPLDKITADNIDMPLMIMDDILPIPVW